MRFNQFVLILFSLSCMVSVSAIEPQINVKVDNLLESGIFSSKDEAYKVSQSIGIKKNIYFVETAYHNRLNPEGFDGIVEIVEINPKDASYGHIAQSAVSELGLGGLMKGLKQALEIEKGELKSRERVRSISRPAPHWTKNAIKKLRENVFNMSQPTFAQLLNVSTATIRAWEQGQRTPDGAAARLLEVLSQDTELVDKLAS
jgi:putative transcriptional regulator